MKESSFYSDDFEQLIRDKTEQYKMYPSERVWKGVHNSLHTKRRWFIGGMSLLVTGILFFAGKELISPSAHAIAHKPAPAAGSTTEAAKPYLAAHLPRTSNSSNHSASAAHHNNAAENDPASEGQDPEYKEISITLSHPVIDPSDLSGWMSRLRLPDHAPEIAVIESRPGVDAGKPAEDAASRATARPGTEASVARDAEVSHETADGYAADGDALSTRSVLESLTERGQRNARITGMSRNTSNGNSIIADGLNPDYMAPSSKANAFAIAEAHDRSRVNWLHDYALNTLPAPRNHGRTLLQLTLSPTVTYRSISGMDPAYAKYGALTGFSGSPNQLFNTSPAFGFEFGGSIVYRVTRNLSIKGGLRFNFTRFQMTSYSISDSGRHWRNDNNSYLGMLVARMSNSGAAGPGQNPTTNSTLDITTSTLNNDFYQLSAPIGMELRVLGNERLTFNLGASVAPSYLLNTTSYTLDQGMTKYARKPQMYSKWNLNGSIEAFLSYRMGDVRWQIGPEFRYQFFNTYSSQSYITEHLKTYGLKIGVVKTLP